MERRRLHPATNKLVEKLPMSDRFESSQLSASGFNPCQPWHDRTPSKSRSFQQFPQQVTLQCHRGSNFLFVIQVDLRGAAGHGVAADQPLESQPLRQCLGGKIAHQSVFSALSNDNFFEG
ncbi:hypothetical protein C1H46_005101 [Malus baccata]|uniref:Uncharacterized protein n=1 Tax=Malus baccata TaxID=106549 RepID=A0A540NDR5_MALBA|nr:hypothetical protein C1H46_005101 [Malus baccata]